MPKMQLIFRVFQVIFFAVLFSLTTRAYTPDSCRYLVGDPSDDPFVVIGRVTDGDGRPIKKAGVSIDPRGATKMLNPYISAVTDENGCFKFVGFGDKKARNREWFLYTTDDFVFPGIALITPPDVRPLQKLDSRYNGIPFVPGKRRIIDVGDVPVVFRFGSAQLAFSNCDESKCSSTIQWGTAEVSLVHCGSNTSVERSTFSKEKLKRFIFDQDVPLSFLLPEGKWKIEIYNQGIGLPVAETSCFEVKAKKVVEIPMQLKASGKPIG